MKMRKDLYRALLELTDSKGWPFITANHRDEVRRVERVDPPIARADKVADQVKRLREYAAQNPHVDIEAEIRRLERQGR